MTTVDITMDQVSLINQAFIGNISEGMSEFLDDAHLVSDEWSEELATELHELCMDARRKMHDKIKAFRQLKKI